MLQVLIRYFICLPACVIAVTAFYSYALRPLNDQEKIAIIEEMADPILERKVFYRWQSTDSRNSLIRAGKITPQLYEHFRGQTGVAGGGLYMAQGPVSSSSFGNTLIQVEVEPGVKYLDLENYDTREELRKKGVSVDDVHRLNPDIAVRYSDYNGWWVFKGQEGVSFKPFNGKGMTSREIDYSYKMLVAKAPVEVLGQQSKDFFADAVREEMVDRAKTNASLINSKIIRDMDESVLQDLVSHHASSPSSTINTTEDAITLLARGSQYLSPEQTKQISDMAVSLIQNYEDGNTLLGFERHLNGKQKQEIIEKITPMIKSSAQGRDLAIYITRYLPPREVERYKNKIAQQTLPLIQNAEEGVGFLKSINLNTLPTGQMDEIVNRMLPLLQDLIDVRQFLREMGPHITGSHKEKILKTFIAGADTGEDLAFALHYAVEKFPPEKAQEIIKEVSSKVNDIGALKAFQEASRLYPEDSYQSAMEQVKKSINSGRSAVTGELGQSMRRLRHRGIKKLKCLQRQLSIVLDGVVP